MNDIHLTDFVGTQAQGATPANYVPSEGRANQSEGARVGAPKQHGNMGKIVAGGVLLAGGAWLARKPLAKMAELLGPVLKREAETLEGSLVRDEVFAKALASKIFERVGIDAQKAGHLSTIAGKAAKHIVGEKGMAAFAKYGQKMGFRELAKEIPIVGTAMGVYFAVKRFRKGDVVGGLLEAGSGLVASFPEFYGTVASLGMDAILAGRDMMKSHKDAAEAMKQVNAATATPHAPISTVPLNKALTIIDHPPVPLMDIPLSSKRISTPIPGLSAQLARHNFNFSQVPSREQTPSFI